MKKLITFEEPLCITKPREKTIEFKYTINGENKHVIIINITELLLRTWCCDKSMDINDDEAIKLKVLPFIIGMIKNNENGSFEKPAKLELNDKNITVHTEKYYCNNFRITDMKIELR